MAIPWQRLGLACSEAWLNCRRAPVPGLLSLSGIVVGAAALVATLNIGEAAQLQSRSQFASLRPDVWLLRAAPKRHAAPSLPRSEIEAMARQIDGVRAAVLIEQRYTSLHSPGLDPLSSPGVTIVRLPELLADLLGLRVVQGRALSDFDALERHVLVGAGLAARLAGLQGRPLQPGDTLSLGNSIYRMVGVLAPTQGTAGLPFEIDESIFERGSGAPGGSMVSADTAVLHVRAELPPDRLRARISADWASVGRGQPPTLEVPTQLLSAMSAQDRLLSSFLIATAAIAMSLGGIGMLNTLFSLVRQRRPEIGIRLAIGAQASDICALFLAEAAALGLIGGCVGGLLGTLGGLAFQAQAGMPFVASLGAGLCAMVLALVVGLLAGVWPAWRAAGMPPVWALRAA